MKYYFFAIRWVWHNRSWENTRQKWKRLDKDWAIYKATGVLSWKM